MIVKLVKTLFDFATKHWKFLVLLGIASIPFIWNNLLKIYDNYSERIVDYTVLTVSTYFKRIIPYLTFSVVLSLFAYFYWRYVIIRQLVEGFILKSNQNIIKHLDGISLVYVVGVIRSGKTSGVKNIIDVISKYKIESAARKLEHIRFKTMYLNYTRINKFIEDNYKLDHVYLKKDYKRFVNNMFLALKMNSFTTKLVKLKFEKELVPLKKVLMNYVELYQIVHLRKVHVISNTSMRNNGVMAARMQESYTQFKRQSNIAIEKYLCELHDESGITDNTRGRAGWYGDSRKEFDDGKEQRFAIKRHPEESTGITFYLGQNVQETSGTMMRFFQMFLKTNMQGKEDILVYQEEVNLFDNVIQWLEYRMNRKYEKKMTRIWKLEEDKSWESFMIFIPPSWLQKKAIKNRSKYETYLDRMNNYKKIIMKLNPYKEKLEEYLLCKRPMEIHFQQESLGLDITKESFPYSAFNLNVYYLAPTVYGEYAEHQFQFLRDLRNAKAKTPIFKAERWISPREVLEIEIKSMQYIQLDGMIDVQKEDSVVDTAAIKPQKKDVSKRSTW